MNIYEIEKLTERKLQKIAEEHIIIKGHDCYLVDFGRDDYFGYSILAFCNGLHVHYANDYELHHPQMKNNKEELKKYYIEKMNNKLFTDEELLEKVSTYDEYSRKDYYLRNYRIMRYPYKSIFGKDNIHGNGNSFPYYCKSSFCYVANKWVAEEQDALCEHLNKEYAKLRNSEEGFREMIRHELFNHEAGITYDPTDALLALGMPYSTLTAKQKAIVRNELDYVIEHTM